MGLLPTDGPSNGWDRYSELANYMGQKPRMGAKYEGSHRNRFLKSGSPAVSRTFKALS